jgi:hypothetical protein
LTDSAGTRYDAGMNVKEQFRQGLQWGAVFGLAHNVVSSLWHFRAINPFFLPYLLPSAAWLVAFALIWTRWSRVAVAVAVVAQTAAAIAITAHMGDVGVTMSACLPLCLPVLPLLFMAPERPRLTVALALLGRWRDAAQTLVGWRWPIVALGVVLLERSGWASLSTAWNSEDRIRIPGQDILIAFAPQAALFALAVLPRMRSTAKA